MEGTKKVRKEKPDLHECANCQKRLGQDRLVPVRALNIRVEPGDPMPSGECPDCGALCYPA